MVDRRIHTCLRTNKNEHLVIDCLKELTSKYLIPETLPLFFPSFTSRIRPTHSPGANCARPTKATVPSRSPGLILHRSPMLKISEQGASDVIEKRDSLPKGS